LDDTPSSPELPLIHATSKLLKDLIEVPSLCSNWNNALVDFGLGEIVIYYKDREVVITNELLELAAKGSSILPLALEGYLYRLYGALERRELICLERIVLKLGSRIARERFEEELKEQLKTRVPSFTSVLAKAIALKMREDLANDIMVDVASEVPYLRLNGSWIWGSEAETYLKARAFEVGHNLVDDLASRFNVDKLKARSALTSNVVNEAIKQVILWSVRPTYQITKLIEEGNRYARLDNKVVDLDYWFKHGVLKKYDNVYDAIVLHRLPQDDFGLPSGNYEGLEDIEAIAEIYTPTLLKAMGEWVPDEEHRLNLWKAMGYAIYPKMPLRKFFLLVGPTSSGKSTFLDFMAYALGPENIASVSLDQLLGSRAEYYAAELFHKLANLADEGINSAIVERRKRSLELLKALVGGSYITARTIYGRPFKFVNYAKLFFATNDERTIDLLKADPAVARRMVVIRFKGSFRDNPSFKERLLEETRRALPVLLVALRVLAKEGFTQVPASSSDLVERVRELCKKACIKRKRSKDLFLPAWQIKATFGISAKRLCELLKEQGVSCRWVKWHGKTGLVFPKYD